jgi:hypothetical protein
MLKNNYNFMVSGKIIGVKVAAVQKPGRGHSPVSNDIKKTNLK